MKKTLLILSLMAIIFASCKKETEEETEPQTCTCPETSVDLDSRVIGTWEKVVKDDNVSKHYLVLKDGSYSYNLVEKNNGIRQIFSGEETFLIQLGLYKVDDNNLTIIRNNNGVEIEVKYTKTNDISVTNWVKSIKLEKNTKFSLYNNGENIHNITKTASKLWGRNYTKLFELDPTDYSIINTIENNSYGWKYGSNMTYVDNKLLLVNDYNDMLLVDENNGDILDTIEINLLNSDLTAVCANNNTIWYFDYSYDNSNNKLIQINLSGDVLKTIDIGEEGFTDIVFINDEMYVTTNDEHFGKFDTSTEEFTESYNFYYDSENDYIGLYYGISVVGDKFLIEYNENANSVNISEF